MFNCGKCNVESNTYEAWLLHLISEEHQALLGISEVFTNHLYDLNRNARSLYVTKKSDGKLGRKEIINGFAQAEPLAFITDVYFHFFQSNDDCCEQFVLVVYDQKKFVNKICELQEDCKKNMDFYGRWKFIPKTTFNSTQWAGKLEESFFYRRHEYLKHLLNETRGDWDEQFSQFLNLVSLKTKGYQDREYIISELESLLHQKFIEAKVEPFGSCITWLADVNADLKVSIDQIRDPRNNYPQDKQMELRVQHKIGEMLRTKYGELNVLAIDMTDKPLIELNHPSGLKINIFFDNSIALISSKLIKLLTKFDYRIRYFLIFLRYWARFQDLISPMFMTNYVLTLFSLVFLRRQKILPSVYELQSIRGMKESTMNNWNTSFCGNRDAIMKKLPWLECQQENVGAGGTSCQSIMKLCYGFFKEFSELDFNTHIVCPLIGSFVPKSLFEDKTGASLPKEMDLLKTNMRAKKCTILPVQCPIVVQDPFILNLNVMGSCCKPELINKFKMACVKAREALKPCVLTCDYTGPANILELTCKYVVTGPPEKVPKVAPLPEPFHRTLQINNAMDNRKLSEDRNISRGDKHSQIRGQSSDNSSKQIKPDATRVERIQRTSMHKPSSN